MPGGDACQMRSNLYYLNSAIPGLGGRAPEAGPLLKRDAGGTWNEPETPNGPR